MMFQAFSLFLRVLDSLLIYFTVRKQFSDSFRVLPAMDV